MNTIHMDKDLIYKRFTLQQEYLGMNKAVNCLRPLVSVCVITYQHASYIEQCLQAILSQETDFNYEVVIGEDGSTDGTRELCMRYAEQYPDKIRLFLRDRSLSNYKHGQTDVRLNGIFTRLSARGRYIALCEGDDYWTDVHKLQRQADFLEAHPEYVLCCHRYRIYDERTQAWREDFLSKHFKENPGDKAFGRDDVHARWYPATLTTMYRATALQQGEYWSHYLYYRDVHMVYHALSQGKGYCMDHYAGVYRKHDRGMYTSLSKRAELVTRYRIREELYRFHKDDAVLREVFRKLVFRLYFSERSHRKYEVIGSMRFVAHAYQLGLLRHLAAHYYQKIRALVR